MTTMVRRLSETEAQIATLALGYVATVYGLSEAELQAAGELRAVLDKLKDGYPFEKTMHDLTAYIADEEATTRNRRALDKIKALYAAAGLDYDRMTRHHEQVILDFAVPAVVTLDTLLALDRMLYEAARPDEDTDHE